MSKTNGKNGDSSTWLTDSVALLTQSATKAFSDLQARAQADIARAEAEVRQARLERDQALKKVQELKKELQAFKEGALENKNALHEAELTIRHHLESAALLQRELLQWKDQARNWQEHFLRVEEERCSLSSRLDELVAERLLHIPTKHQKTHVTTSSSYINPIYPSSTSSLSLPLSGSDSGLSQTIVHQTTNCDPKSVTAESTKQKVNGLLPRSAPSPRSPLKQAKLTTRHGASSSSRPRKAKSSSLPSTSANVNITSQPQVQPKLRETTVLRRVQAVVRVKQESDSEEDLIGQDQSPLNDNDDIHTGSPIDNTNDPDQIRTQPQPPSQSRSQSSVEDSPEQLPLSPSTPRRTRAAKANPKSVSKLKTPSKRNRRIILDEDDYTPSETEGGASTRRRERKRDVHMDANSSVVVGKSPNPSRKNLREDTSGDTNPEVGVEDEDDELMIGAGDDLSFGIEEPDGLDEGNTDASKGARKDEYDNHHNRRRGGDRTDKGAVIVDVPSVVHTPQRSQSTATHTVGSKVGSTNGKKRKLTTGNGISGRPTARRKT